MNGFGTEDGERETKQELPRFIHSNCCFIAEFEDTIVGLMYWEKRFLKMHQSAFTSGAQVLKMSRAIETASSASSFTYDSAGIAGSGNASGYRDAR